jgi:hypothetical protein
LDPGGYISAARYYTGDNWRSGVVSITAVAHGGVSAQDCDGCPSGMTTLQEASMLHSDCKAKAGYYGPDPAGANTAEAYAAAPCAVGKYKETTGAEVCKDCPDNSGTGTATGSTHNIAYVANIGYQGPDGSIPAACPAEKYKAGIGQTSCAAPALQRAPRVQATPPMVVQLALLRTPLVWPR